ncbi:hypothetical protein DFQ27_007792 [Actinomortierella ambigua]|uniref:Signal recognition particle 9 kDa protein n=1 Tax=Actinomortierella ambigua TaxID=1343610 RepID=A0A9P6PVD2_9FUNG|nr:hypothetical protein DFQ26_008411 [Actinomortierella ambigua]KAG0252885.1 hypothetical protein DFQ27_007792 [Actinomortierella ambigua]
MVNITNWDEFQRAAEELYSLSPNNTRYVAKYRHTEGKLVLKVTDDRTCFKYKTDQLQDLNKFERLNRSLMAKMHNRAPVELAAPAASTTQQPADHAPAVPVPAPTSGPAASPAATPKPSGKKKNKRK